MTRCRREVRAIGQACQGIRHSANGPQPVSLPGGESKLAPASNYGGRMTQSGPESPHDPKLPVTYVGYRATRLSTRVRRLK